MHDELRDNANIFMRDNKNIAITSPFLPHFARGEKKKRKIAQ